MEKELKEMKVLGNNSPTASNRVKAMEAVTTRMTDSRNESMSTALVSVEMRNKASDMCAHIAALEPELNELKALGDNSAQTVEQVKAMEAVIARMKNSAKDVNDGITESFHSSDGSGTVNQNNPGGCFTWFIENIVSMTLRCFGISRRAEDCNTGENITSPLIENRMVRGKGIADQVERSEKRTFLEWLNYQEIDQSDKEWESVLMELKGEVIAWGFRLSELLLDFILLASEGGDNMEIFETFRGILDLRFHKNYNHLVVVKRVFKFLEIVEKDLKDLKNKSGESSKAEKSMDLISQKKHLAYDLADNFSWQILNLEMLVNKVLLTKSVLVKTMKESFDEGNEELNKIEKDLGKLRTLVPSWVKEDLKTIKALKLKLDGKVGKLWSGFCPIRNKSRNREVPDQAKFEA